MTKTIIYTCCFVPPEWIAAHRKRPCRLVPSRPAGTSGGGTPAGMCPYAHAFVRQAARLPAAEAVVVTTACDQMRRGSELIARDSALPVFLMNVPATWQTAAPQRLYIDELRRLGAWLVELGGTAPSDDELAGVMLEYDSARAALRAAGGHLRPRRFAEAIAELNATGRCSVDDAGRCSVDDAGDAGPRRGVPLALLGGPVPPSDFGLFDVIERAGGRVALDATDTGRRALPAPFDRRALRSRPLTELARAYPGSIPHVFQRPNSRLYEWLGRELCERNVRGIVLRRYLWCDLWHAELERLRQWRELPVLDLDVGDRDEADGRTEERIQSFLEILQ